MRLGYMGHLTLIAEEVVKFAERHQSDVLGDLVARKIGDLEWINYVENILTETRDRDNAILGGVRPETGNNPRQAAMNAANAAQDFGGTSNALANAGLGGEPQGLDSMDLANIGDTGRLLSSGFGSSDEEEDEDMEESEGPETPRETADEREQVGNFSFEDTDMEY